MKKSGFTLIELLAVIAIIGVLAIMVVPNVVDSYKNSLNKSMEIVENNVKDAANIYVNEHCTDPLYDPGTGTLYTCPSSYNSSKFVCLSELTSGSEPYIESVKYSKTDCKGVITFDSTGANVYLACGSEYYTDKNVSSNSVYNECFK